MMRKNNKKLNRVATVVAKITEVFHWVSVGLLIASLIAFLFDEKLLKYFIDTGNGEFAVAGYSINVLNDSGNFISPAFISALAAGIIVCGLMAMIFRNIYLIFKTTAGKTRFSKGATPFQPDNVRMLREIGIFSLFIPIIEFICDVIVKVIVDPDLIESSVSVTGIVFGIALLCLSQFFAYGTQLQNDSDGLL